ncbi:MAG: NAD(P)-dependent alcohol dehydrogenase [Myxococcota bacterium]
MQAIVHDVYGPPEVLRLEDREPPALGEGDLRIDVRATSVTTAEWRMRSADYGSGLFALAGRLMFGLFRPRNRTTGREFAGRVTAVGSAVTNFAVGDDVFGTHPGANAEQLVIPASGMVVRMPAGLTHAEAAALPFGSICALDFLEDRAKVRPGERVLVVGASGGVGVYLVQVAKALGAEVTGVCSTANRDLVRRLGADHVVDYTTTDLRTLPGPFDVIVDTVGQTSFAQFRRMLSPTGRHVFIEGGLGEFLQSMTSALRSGPRVISGVSADSREALERVRARVEQGTLRPVVGHRFAMADVVQAHRLVQARHRRGAVVLEFPAAAHG